MQAVKMSSRFWSLNSIPECFNVAVSEIDRLNLVP
jgi:hypothetical protein